jgi:hypothetical protein
MGMVGDVVFCVDCDLARSQHQKVSGAADGGLEAPPRRMATKKDASGAALCAVCMDARLQRRRAEFVLHQGRSTAPEPTPPSISPQPAHESLRKLSSVRIARVRPPAEAPATSRARAEAPATSRARAKAPAKLAVKPLPVKPPVKLPTRARLVAETLSQVRAATTRGGTAGDDRQSTSSFLQLASDIGFVRAYELLGEIRTRVLR